MNGGEMRKGTGWDGPGTGEHFGVVVGVAFAGSTRVRRFGGKGTTAG